MVEQTRNARAIPLAPTSVILTPGWRRAPAVNRAHVFAFALKTMGEINGQVKQYRA